MENGFQGISTCSVLKLDSAGNVVWRSQGNALTGRYIVETKNHALLTSSRLVFDPATGDTSRFTGFPGDNIPVYALKTVNNKIYIAIKDEGGSKVGYFDEASGNFIYEVWAQDYTDPDGQSATFSAAYNGLTTLEDGSVFVAGNDVAATRGGVFSYPFYYTRDGLHVQYGGDSYAQFYAAKAFPSGNKVITCLWAWYENKFWIIKYSIPQITARWTGVIDTAWEKPGNWSTNTVPTRSTKAVIPANVPNYPVVNINAVCFSLQVDSSAAVKVNTGFNIEITGK